MECSICLQRFINPVQLSCGHIFCFLCVKGAANLSKRCAICRQEIPENFFENPSLLDSSCIEAPLFDEDYQWFYEGRNGWWLYDTRTSEEIEEAYKTGHKRCELLIAGFLYIIDFESFMQYRRNDPRRKRKIKRDHPDYSSTKGIAGIRITPGNVINAETGTIRTGSVQPEPTAPEDVESGETVCKSSALATEAGRCNEEDALSAQLLDVLDLRTTTYRETYL